MSFSIVKKFSYPEQSLGITGPTGPQGPMGLVGPQGPSVPLIVPLFVQDYSDEDVLNSNTDTKLNFDISVSEPGYYHIHCEIGMTSDGYLLLHKNGALCKKYPAVCVDNNTYISSLHKIIKLDKDDKLEVFASVFSDATIIPEYTQVFAYLISKE